MPSVHDFHASTIGGSEVSLASYAGQVLLVVNTASQCGLTPQYSALEQLYLDLGPRGFCVLGFPCNQFGRQEPGSNDDIAAFCARRAVTFPMFARIDVNGRNAHPLYAHLRSARPGLLGSGAVKWNFTKFLVDRAGVVAARFGPAVRPASIRPKAEQLLG